MYLSAHAMRFPLALTAKIAAYIIGKKLSGVEKFATVLQLEPLHTCNLTCTGCGRIREYSTSLKDMMPLEDCLGAAAECDAPMVSICGGEPLIYPEIEALVRGLLAQKRIVYVCTNAMFMRKKMREYLAAEFARDAAAVEAKLQVLLSEELISAKDAEEIRKGPKDAGQAGHRADRAGCIGTSISTASSGRTISSSSAKASSRKASLAMRMAKMLGYQVATNTTVYKETEVQEIEDMFAFLSSLGVDGHTISPGYEYDAAKKDMVKRLGIAPENFFLTRKMTVEKFAQDRGVGPQIPDLRHAGVSRIPRRQARPDLLRLGDPDPQHPRLERPVLPDDRRPLRQLPRAAGEDRLGQVSAWSMAWRAIRAARIA